MVVSQACHGVGEFHGGCVVQLEQSAPAERGEGISQIADREVSSCGQVDPVNRPGQLDQVIVALC
jgi:hypothetical protein